MTTRTAPRGLLVLVYVGRAKSGTTSGQVHLHAKPAVKCVVRSVAHVLSWHWRHGASKPLASAWLTSGVAFYQSETRASWGAAAFVIFRHGGNAGWRCGGQRGVYL
ncbi:hypothetical protein PROQFM164_S01g000679 [Penicillium roqueforti FM164]|uniref:Uncharacterized protein n=1 Tax=Penicillium roqueforti (strain FM164) TaxID=1365484 RepID=W6PSN6_PENRF|nr:hypothetical protein PROQFM164_S01g000679 [Penicillium roqueforti FM164]